MMKKQQIRFLFVFIGLVAISAALGPLPAGSQAMQAQVEATIGPTLPPQDRPLNSLRDLNNAFIEIASEVKPTVVTVFTEKTYRFRQSPLMNPFLDFFYGPQGPPPEREYRQQGLGSGVIVSSEGNILTNHHVIAEADSIFVRTYDGKRYPAEVLGSDPNTDIAVIRIDADNLPAIRIGDSDELKVGELVLAVGSPMSENLAHTVTQGIVSAKGRSNIGLADYEDFIQTDAAINPGNSGGALVNLDGELVGINSAIVSRTGGFQGIGFAVPANMAVAVMNSLLSTGRVVRGWLGVSIQDINQAIAEAMGLEVQAGALVGDVVKDGPADKAGFEAGDVIVEMDGRAINSASQLRSHVASTPPGTKVTFKVSRDGDRESITVELGELPSEFAATAPSSNLEDLLGFEFSNLTRDIIRQYNLDPGLSGIVVTSIDRTSRAFEAGLREGDVIRSVNRRRVESVQDFNQIMGGAERGTSLLMRIYRDQSTFFIAFTL